MAQIFTKRLQNDKSDESKHITYPPPPGNCHVTGWRVPRGVTTLGGDRLASTGQGGSFPHVYATAKKSLSAFGAKYDGITILMLFLGGIWVGDTSRPQIFQPNSHF